MLLFASYIGLREHAVNYPAPSSSLPRTPAKDLVKTEYDGYVRLKYFIAKHGNSITLRAMISPQ